MPSSAQFEIGVPTGSPQQLSELETHEHSPGEHFGPSNPGSFEVWPVPEIWQWLIRKLHWAHITRDFAPVKGRSTRGWYLSCAWPETGWSQNVLIAARKEPACGGNS